MFWCYEIAGIAYDSDHKPLVNETIVVDDDTVTTDGEGRFRAQVCGVGCDRGSMWEVRRCNRENYNHIVIKRLVNGRSERIKSKWRKYGLRPAIKGTDAADRTVWNKNLHFS